MPGCSARFENSDRAAMLGQMAAHAASAHGLDDISPEILTAVESKISFAA